MSSNDDAPPAPAAWQLPGIRRDTGLTLKAAAAVALSIIALIPLMQVQDLVDERWWRHQQVIDDIGQAWGPEQRISGPYLKVPLQRSQLRADGSTGSFKDQLMILPESLDITVNVEPSVRHRGIFEAVVYVANVTIEGRFPPIEPDMLPSDLEAIDWDDVSLRMDVSDARSIRGNIETEWEGVPAGLQTIIAATVMPYSEDVLGAHITLDHEDNAVQGGSFRISYEVAGSRRLDVIPAAGETAATIRSPWTAPSFDGAFLPLDTDVGTDGFAAQWTIFEYARGFPLSWLGGEASRLKEGMDRSIFGVRLIEEVGLYRKTERAVKYGLLFFAATFLTYLILEVSTGARLHVLHYGLVGSALCIFYVLLLSLAEVIGFSAAYAISAAAVVVQTSIFTWSVIRRRSASLAFAAVLICVYGYLYVLLDLEDLALLGGALGLFALLSAAMYALRGLGGTAQTTSQETSS